MTNMHAVRHARASNNCDDDIRIFGMSIRTVETILTEDIKLHKSLCQVRAKDLLQKSEAVLYRMLQ